MNWLRRLFTRNNRKTRKVLSDEYRNHLLIDFCINKMSRKELVDKYDVSYTTVCKIIRNEK